MGFNMQFMKVRKVTLVLTMMLMCGMFTNQVVSSNVPDSAIILTPKAGPEPRINGPKIFGVRPGHPILFTIPVTGVRPIRYSADKLPLGVKLNGENGQITGSIAKPGVYEMMLTAKNSIKKVSRKFKIVVGEEISLTPPMGWNSYNVYVNRLTQELATANARAMVSSGLINHGWSYINLDDHWQGRREVPGGPIQPKPRTFPNIKAMVDEIHQLGLKAGIYSTPWVEAYEGQIGGSANNPEGTFQMDTLKTPKNRKIMPFAIGRYSFVKQDVKQWAEWGFDYLKYDWNPNELPETKEMYDALRASGRDFAFSLSNSTPFKNIAELSKLANAWRTGGDIRDRWTSLKSRIFTQDKWAPFARPGHWNDPDMMVLGVLGWWDTPRPTKLTADEQYTHMSAWCLMSVPLLLGCDLTRLDDFTLGLLTNDEVIAVNQDVLGKQAIVVSTQGEIGVMAKEMEDGSKAVGLFNLGDGGKMNVTVKWTDLGIKGKFIVRDLWRQKDLGMFENEFTADVNQHGVVMVQIRPAK
jgi:alpha-galactosidase